MVVISTNKAKYFLSVAILATLAMLVVGPYKVAGSHSIKVTVPFIGKIDTLGLVKVTAHTGSVAKSLNRSWFGDSIYEDFVMDWARKNGIETIRGTFASRSPIEPEKEITVTTDIETGLPYLGRHFNVLNWHYSRIVIKLIDLNDNKVIGEVEYIRPFMRMDPHDIFEMILNQLLNKQYGLTDFSRWERRLFTKSHIAIDLPFGFHGYDDKAYDDKYPSVPVLSLFLHELKHKDGVSFGLTIFFDEMTQEKFVRIKEEMRNVTNKDTLEYLTWLSQHHEEISKRNELPVNGPFINYIKDYSNRQGRMVRASAGLNSTLRQDGPLPDEVAITRLLNSVELE